MKKLYLIFSLAILALFSACESLNDTTYQLYYDSFGGANQIKRVEVREFNDDIGNYENLRTISLNIGEKSEMYSVDSDIAFLEIKVVAQYSQTQEVYFINHYHLTKGEDNLIKLSSLK